MATAAHQAARRATQTSERRVCDDTFVGVCPPGGFDMLHPRLLGGSLLILIGIFGGREDLRLTSQPSRHHWNWMAPTKPCQKRQRTVTFKERNDGNFRLVKTSTEALRLDWAWVGRYLRHVHAITTQRLSCPMYLTASALEPDHHRGPISVRYFSNKSPVLEYSSVLRTRILHLKLLNSIAISYSVATRFTSGINF